jgi:hypothetical protein
MRTPTIKDIRVAAAARKRRRERARLWGWALAGTMVLAVVLSTFVLPPWLRGQIEIRASAELGRKVTLERLRINPLRWSATLEGMQIREHEGAPLLGWTRLHVNFDSWSWLRREWRFQAIALEGFHLQIRVDEDGRLNFADLLERPAVDEAAAAWPLFIGRLDVAEARVDFADASRAAPFATVVGPLTFRLRDFHTRPEREARHAFVAQTEAGEHIEWRGNLTLVPLQSSGEFRLHDLALPNYQPYFDEWVAFGVLGGRLDLAGDYVFEGLGERPLLRWTRGEVALRDLALGDAGSQEPQVRLTRIHVEGIEADLATRRVNVGTADMAGGYVALRHTAAGLDLARWAERPAGPIGAVVEKVATKDAAWRLRLGQMSLAGLGVEFTDETLSRPARLVGRDLTLSGHALVLGDAAPAGVVTLAGRVESGGELHFSGVVAPDTLTLEGMIEVRDLALADFAPYLANHLNATLPHGVLAVAGRVAGTWPRMKFTGQAQVRDFALADLAEEQPLLAFTTLDLQGIELGLEPLRLDLEAVTWEQPMARVAVRTDGSLNLADLVVANEPVLAPRAPGEPPVITVGQVAVRQAALTFTDASLSPAVRLRWHDLSGTVTGLDSRRPGSGELMLTGRVDGIAPITVRGRLNPLGQPSTVDLQLDLRQLDLLPTGPYLNKYAGYRLGRGRLSADLAVRLEDRRLDSTTVVTLDQFTLGERTPGRDATNLPVALAVALLKDTRGRIVIDLPVQGSLDDPEFRIGRVVRRVIVNLLTQVATSPFALLGAIVGGGAGEELAWQDFAPGRAALDAEDIQKLDTVARALAARPELRLALAGSHDPARDQPVLQAAALAAALRAARARETPGAAPADDQAAHARAVGRLYAERFSAEVARLAARAAETRPPAASPAPPPGRESAVRDDSVWAWLRGLFRGDARPADEPPVVATDPDSSPVEASAIAADPAVITVAEMEARLRDTFVVTLGDLEALALTRAQAVKEHLLARDPALAARVELVATTADGARVNLSLR